MASPGNTRLHIFHVIANPLDHLYGQPHGEYPALDERDQEGP